MKAKKPARQPAQPTVSRLRTAAPRRTRRKAPGQPPAEPVEEESPVIDLKQSETLVTPLPEPPTVPASEQGAEASIEMPGTAETVAEVTALVVAEGPGLLESEEDKCARQIAEATDRVNNITFEESGGFIHSLGDLYMAFLHWRRGLFARWQSRRNRNSM